MSIADAMDRFRQPEYTGANRCMPCTMVNVLIAAAVSGTVAVLVPWVGMVAFVAFAVTIYLRGYLVPGTPALTKRYLPARVLRLFGKNPIERSFDGGTTSTASGVAAPGTTSGGLEPTDAELGGAVAAAGVLRRANTGDVALTPAFRDEWRERIRTIRERSPGEDDVLTMFDAESVSRHGDQSFVLDGNTSIRWGSNAALVADVAAAELLRERGSWTDFDRNRQRSVLRGLRLCLDRCPSCDGTVERTEERVDPCCQKPHLVADAVCRDCNAALADAAVVDHGEGESVRARLLLS